MDNACKHRSHRCFICGERFEETDEVYECEDCEAHIHILCLEDREHEHCPRCTGEAWIGSVEF